MNLATHLQNKVSHKTIESFSIATANYPTAVIAGLKDSELDLLFDELKIPVLDRSAIRLVLKDLNQTHPHDSDNKEVPTVQATPTPDKSSENLTPMDIESILPTVLYYRSVAI